MPSDRASITWTAESSDLFGGSGEPARSCLWVLHSPDPDLRDRRLLLEERLVLGRGSGEGIDATVRDPRVSRQHVELTRFGESPSYELLDLRSRNGTWVNGAPVSSAILSWGDIVRFGDTLAKVGPLSRPDLPDPVIIGTSAAMTRALEEVQQAAQSQLPALVLGEAGVGKSLVAKRIHELSGRGGNFVAINCGAIPSELVESYLFGHKKGAFTGATSDAVGVFEEAGGGTLLLDEIGSMPAPQQPKLLRVLENREFSPVGSPTTKHTDARVVAATNTDLRRAVAGGTFRHDLFTRLAGLVVHVPPLRQRAADIPRLLSHFAEMIDASRPLHWSADGMERLLLYDWPGNVRELRFFVERLLLAKDLLTDEGRVSAGLVERTLAPLGVDPPGALGADAAAGDQADARAAISPGGMSPGGRRAPQAGPGDERPGREELAAALAQLQGNVTQVAARFGKDPKQVYRWMALHDLDPNDYRPV